MRRTWLEGNHPEGNITGRVPPNHSIQLVIDEGQQVQAWVIAVGHVTQSTIDGWIHQKDLSNGAVDNTSYLEHPWLYILTS